MNVAGQLLLQIDFLDYRCLLKSSSGTFPSVSILVLYISTPLQYIHFTALGAQNRTKHVNSP